MAGTNWSCTTFQIIFSLKFLYLPLLPVRPSRGWYLVQPCEDAWRFTRLWLHPPSAVWQARILRWASCRACSLFHRRRFDIMPPRTTRPMADIFQRFDSHLRERHKLTLHEPASQNGYDCMFLALVHALGQELGDYVPDSVTPSLIREGARCWLKQHSDELVELNPGKEPTRIKHFKSEYADFMENDQAWGNHPVLLGALGFLAEAFRGVIFQAAIHRIPVLPAEDISPPTLIRLPFAYEVAKGLKSNAHIIVLHICHLPEQHYYSTQRLLARNTTWLEKAMECVTFRGSAPCASLPSTSTCPLEGTDDPVVPLSALQDDAFQVYSLLNFSMNDEGRHSGAHSTPLHSTPLQSTAPRSTPIFPSTASPLIHDLRFTHG